MSFAERIKKIPVFGKLATKMYIQWLMRAKFRSSAAYWENRYKNGGDSGVGSYAHLAACKAEIINRFVAENGIKTVIEFGCGDGHQLSYFRFPSYTGFDVSETAVERCRTLYQNDGSKRFQLMKAYQNETADLILSLDVIYHLVEDDVFQTYMSTLFAAARQFVIIYSNNTNDNRYHTRAPHVKNRHFTGWVEEQAPGYCLQKHLVNPYASESFGPLACFTDFYIYEKTDGKMTDDR